MSDEQKALFVMRILNEFAFLLGEPKKDIDSLDCPDKLEAMYQMAEKSSLYLLGQSKTNQLKV